MKLSVRAWDKKNKRMFYAGSMSGVGDFYEARHCDYNESDNGDFFESFASIDYEWMQSTMCRDKKGRYIYDGDIVKSEVALRNVFKEEFIAYVSVDLELSGCINLRNKNELVSDKPFIEYVGKLEVIGNKYENPELLD